MSNNAMSEPQGGLTTDEMLAEALAAGHAILTREPFTWRRQDGSWRVMVRKGSIKQADREKLREALEKMNNPQLPWDE